MRSEVQIDTHKQEEIRSGIFLDDITSKLYIGLAKNTDITDWKTNHYSRFEKKQDVYTHGTFYETVNEHGLFRVHRSEIFHDSYVDELYTFIMRTGDEQGVLTGKRAQKLFSYLQAEEKLYHPQKKLL